MKMEYSKEVVEEKNDILRFEYKLASQLRNMFHLDDQPERLSPEDVVKDVCDSPNTANK